jgi:hypothetical protein
MEYALDEIEEILKNCTDPLDQMHAIRLLIDLTYDFNYLVKICGIIRKLFRRGKIHPSNYEFAQWMALEKTKLL